jgi:hypothetical protein
MNESPRLLTDQELRATISLAGLFLIAFEALDGSIVDRVRGYLEVPGTPLRFEAEIARLPGKGVREKCSAWLAQLGALQPGDAELIGRAVRHRNEIAHEFARLTLGDLAVDVELLADVVQLGLRLDRWWIRNVDIAIDPDLASADIEDDEIIPGTHMLLSYVIARLFPEQAPH